MKLIDKILMSRKIGLYLKKWTKSQIKTVQCQSQNELKYWDFPSPGATNTFSHAFRNVSSTPEVLLVFLYRIQANFSDHILDWNRERLL